jgi:hypothetical protein
MLHTASDICLFERYAIVSRTDIADALQKLQHIEEATRAHQSHETVTIAVPLTQTPQQAAIINSVQPI